MTPETSSLTINNNNKRDHGFSIVYIHVYNCENIQAICIYIYTHTYAGFHKWGYPKIAGLYWKIPLQRMMTGGYPYFRKPPDIKKYVMPTAFATTSRRF